MPLRDEDYLILSTIHSAKGQEWRSVFVLNVVDGCMPSDMATGTAEEIEEERRLLYVAMTRAKDQLALVTPQKFYIQQQSRTGDRHVFASRTRFIPPAIMDAFEASLGRPWCGLPARRRPRRHLSICARRCGGCGARPGVDESGAARKQCS